MMTKVFAYFFLVLTVIWAVVTTSGFVNIMVYEGVGQSGFGFYGLLSALFAFGYHMIFLCYLILKSKCGGWGSVFVLILVYGSFYVSIASHGKGYFSLVLHIFIYFFSVFYCLVAKKLVRDVR